MSGYLSAVGRAQNRKSSLVKDRRSTTCHGNDIYSLLLVTGEDFSPEYLPFYLTYLENSNGYT